MLIERIEIALASIFSLCTCTNSKRYFLLKFFNTFERLECRCMKNNKNIKRVKFYGYAMKLSNEQRARAVGMLAAGVHQATI